MPDLYAMACGVLFPRLGSNMNPPMRAADDADRFRRLLDACPVGGLILFNGSLDETPAALERLHAHAGRRLVVSADIERGAGQQAAGATVFPHAAAFAAAGAEAEALAEEAACVTAREARAAGIDAAFAPVADVNRNRSNPIIATRAFSADAAEAARLVRACVRGLHRGGLAATAKHFPGHGSTAEDSHERLPVAAAARAELEAHDLRPFREAVAAGVDAVMTAHVAFPALDPSGAPATLSAPILEGLLRREMGFGGAVVTDSLLMGAIRDAYPEPGAFAAALLAAGADVLLDPAEPAAMAEGIVRAVEQGALPRARLEAALGRIARLRRAPEGAACPADGAALAQRIARRAVSVLEAAPGALPLRPDQDLVFVLAYPFRTHLDPPTPPLREAVAQAFPRAAFFEVGPDPAPEETARIEARAARADCTVFAAIVKPAAWRAFGLPEAQARLLARLAAAPRRLVLAALGAPLVLDEAPAAAKLCAYSDVAASQHALVEALARGA